MKKLLILGATGIIGQNLVDFFNRQVDRDMVRRYEVIRHGLERADDSCVVADLTCPKEVDRLISDVKPDIVIQAAASTTGSKDVIERPYVHVTDNAVMNSLLFRSCMQNEVERVIFFSCTVMYQPRDYPQKESDWSGGDEIFSSYFGVGNTKVYIEKMCDFFSRISNTKYTAIRHSNVYGPHDKYDLERSHIFGATVTKVLSAPANGTISVWGSGRAARDLIYIDDLVDFVDKCIDGQENNYELFNVGSGVAYPIIDIVNKIIEASGRTDLSIEFDPSKPDIPTTVMINCDKAEELVGWTHETSLEEGIIKTLEWCRKSTLPF